MFKNNNKCCDIIILVNKLLLTINYLYLALFDSFFKKITCLLSMWCEINYSGPYNFKNKYFFDGNWNYCETFKLEFDDNNNLINIENIKFD